MEATGDDVALEPDQATTTHAPISCRMVPSLRRSVELPWCYPFLMTEDLNRVYDNHQYSRSVWKDNATHGTFLARPHWRPRTFHGHRRVARVPLHPAQTGLVQPSHCHLARSFGIVHTCVRVSRVYTVREAQSTIRRAHHPRRDVWPRDILWYVLQLRCDVSCCWTRFA